MTVKMNLCLELVPQFVVRWPLHVTAQQLDLLHPERQTKGRCYFEIQAFRLGWTQTKSGSPVKNHRVAPSCGASWPVCVKGCTF